MIFRVEYTNSFSCMLKRICCIGDSKVESDGNIIEFTIMIPYIFKSFTDIFQLLGIKACTVLFFNCNTIIFFKGIRAAGHSIRCFFTLFMCISCILLLQIHIKLFIFKLLEKWSIMVVKCDFCLTDISFMLWITSPGFYMSVIFCNFRIIFISFTQRKH